MRPPAGLAARLWLAFGLVVITGGATLVTVAGLMGPRLFREHLRQVSDVPAGVGEHVEQAYASANVVALAGAALAALLASAVASLLIARRLRRPITALATAAGQVADGRYGARMPPPRLGPEFDRVTAAFNQMSGRLQEVEATRRRLLADLAHEMRTPVATIEAYLDAAADGVEVPGEDPALVLRRQTARLRRLAEDLGAVGRAEELAVETHPVPPARLVTAAVNAARAAFDDKRVTLRARCQPDLPQVAADPERIEQVLGNLLDNALRHTPAGGTVTVTCCADDRGVRLSVSDTGEGIDAAHLPHLFERFYRADPARRRDHDGSGIGLAIVRAIALAHGGRVEAHSPGPGHGARFTVTLPATEPSPTAEGAFIKP